MVGLHWHIIVPENNHTIHPLHLYELAQDIHERFFFAARIPTYRYWQIHSAFEQFLPLCLLQNVFQRFLHHILPPGN